MPQKFCNVSVRVRHVLLSVYEFFVYFTCFLLYYRTRGRLLVINKSEISVSFIENCMNQLPLWLNPKQQTNQFFLHLHVWLLCCLYVFMVLAETLGVIYRCKNTCPPQYSILQERGVALIIICIKSGCDVSDKQCRSVIQLFVGGG